MHQTPLELSNKGFYKLTEPAARMELEKSVQSFNWKSFEKKYNIVGQRSGCRRELR